MEVLSISLTRVSQATWDWISRGRVCIPPGLELSFQRFARPEKNVIGSVPSSLGALPIGLGAAHALVLPLADNEAFWIGLRGVSSSSQITLAVAVELENAELLDAISGKMWDAGRPSKLSISDTPLIAGIRRPDGQWKVFARKTSDSADSPCFRLLFKVNAECVNGGDQLTPTSATTRLVALNIVDYAAFVAETGQPPPNSLDLNAGYKGWRLP